MGNAATKYSQEADLLSKAGIGAPELLRMLDTIRELNQVVDLDEAVSKVSKDTCQILSCDRCTIFLVDDIREQLVLKETAVSGGVEIRIPWDKGLAGTVFQEGQVLNIPDAYKDDRFNKATDVSTGYKTVSLLCCPIRDAGNRIVAVMQCINKQDPKSKAIVPFSEIDILMFGHLSSQVGVILKNCIARDQQKASEQKVRAMFDIIRGINAGMGTASLIFTITNRTPALVGADRCTVYVLDRARKELVSMQGAVEIRIPQDKGIAGAVIASGGERVNIPDAYQDSRFNQDFDKKSGYRTKSILCMPIKSSTGAPIGVIQLINKLDGTGFFSENDETLLAGFLDIAGSMIEQSQVFQTQKQQLSEMDKIKSVMKKAPALAGAMGGMTIAEGDEEEEEEEDDEE